MEFEVVIEAPGWNYKDPKFESIVNNELPRQSVEVGSHQWYELPKITDADGDAFEI